MDEPTAAPAKLEGSLVAFTKNGQLQGIAYRSFPYFRAPPVFSYMVHTNHTHIVGGGLCTTKERQSFGIHHCR